MSDSTSNESPTMPKSALKKSPQRHRSGAATEVEIEPDLDPSSLEVPATLRNARTCTRRDSFRCPWTGKKIDDPSFTREWRKCHRQPTNSPQEIPTGCRYDTHLERVVPECVKADTSSCRKGVGTSRNSPYLKWQRWYDGESDAGEWWRTSRFAEDTKTTDGWQGEGMYRPLGAQRLRNLGVTAEERQARADKYYRGKREYPTGISEEEKAEIDRADAADAADADADDAADATSSGGRRRGRKTRRRSKRKPSKKRRGRKTRGRKTRGRKTKKRRNVRHKRKTMRHKKRGGGATGNPRSKTLRRRMERQETPPQAPHEHDPLQERGYPPHDRLGGPDVGMQNLVEALRTSLDNPTRDEMRSTYRDAYKTFYHLPEEMKENFIIRAVNDRREEGGRLPEVDVVLYEVLNEVANYREKIREETSKYGHKISPRYDAQDMGRSPSAATWGVAPDPPCCSECKQSLCGRVFCGKKRCYPCKFDPYNRTLVADLDSDQMECEVSPRGGGRSIRHALQKNRAR